MKIPSPRPTRRMVVAISTVTVVTLFFCYYFLIHVKNNEERIISFSFNNLVSITNGVHQKYMNYNKAVTSIETGGNEINSLIKKYFTPNQSESVSVVDELTTLLRTSTNLSPDLILSSAKILDAKSYEKALHQKVKNDSLHFLTTFEKGQKKDTCLVFKIHIGDFLNSELTKNQNFEKFIIFKSDTVLYQSPPYHIKIFPFDSAIKVTRSKLLKEGISKSGKQDIGRLENQIMDQALSFPNLYDITLSNIPYKLFVHQFEFSPGQYWTIGGLIDEAKFTTEKRSVDPTTLLIVALLLIFILLGSQVIKIFVLSKVEQFYLHNIIFTVLSVTSVTSLIILAILSIIGYWSEDRYYYDTHLKSWATQIESSLHNEIDLILERMEYCDDSVFKDKFNFKDRVSWDAVKNDSSKQNEFLQYSFDNVYWINDEGFEMFQVYDRVKPTGFLDLTGRPYFSRLRDRTGFGYTSPNTDYKDIFIQSITSWVTGKKRAVISTYSKESNREGKEDREKPLVIATATSLRSIQNTISPMGYGYAIIDENGNVLFHTDENLNNQENFLTECTERHKIRSAMLSRNIDWFSVNYHNKLHRIFIKPIKNLPYYLVTFHDRSLLKFPTVIVFYYTLILTILHTVILFFWILVSILLNTRSTKLKSKEIILNWMFPDMTKKLWYKKTILLNALIMLIFLGSIFAQNILRIDPSINFCFMIILANYSFVFIYLYINKYPSIDKEKQKHLTPAFTDKIFIIWFIFVVMVNILLFQGLVLQQAMIIVIQQILYILAFIIVIRINQIKFLPNRILSLFRKKPYTLFLFSWLILISVIPPAMYFVLTYESENTSLTKLEQSTIIRKVTERKNSLRKEKNLADSYKGFYLIKSDFIDSLNIIDGKQKANNSESKEFVSGKKGVARIDHDALQLHDTIVQNFNFKYIQDFYYHLRPFVSDFLGLTHAFTKINQDDDPMYQWTIDPFNKKVKMVYRSGKNNDSALLISSFQHFNTYSKIFASVVIILFLIGIYFLVQVILEKIFCFRFLETPEAITSDHGKIISNIQKDQDSFIVGLPSPSYEELKEKIKEDLDLRDKYYINLIDLNKKDITDVLEDKAQLRSNIIILDHFEFHADNEEHLRTQLRLISKLKDQQKHIIIFSTISMIQLLERFKHLIGYSSTPNSPGSVYESEKNNWVYLLQSFTVYHLSLKHHEIGSGIKRTNGLAGKKLFETLEKELSVSTYFKKIEKYAYEKYNSMIENSKDVKDPREIIKLQEELILYIQDLAQPYYYSLWATCSKRDRFILYDLAYDNFANFKDKTAVLFMLKKGLLRYENGMKIMNDSFRNFILDTISKKESLEMTKEMREQGNWSVTKTVLGILAVAIVVFLVLVKGDSINEIVALLTGMVALLGAFLRFRNFSLSSNSGDSN